MNNQLTCLTIENSLTNSLSKHQQVSSKYSLSTQQLVLDRTVWKCISVSRVVETRYKKTWGVSLFCAASLEHPCLSWQPGQGAIVKFGSFHWQICKHLRSYLIRCRCGYFITFSLRLRVTTTVNQLHIKKAKRSYTGLQHLPCFSVLFDDYESRTACDYEWTWSK